MPRTLPTGLALVLAAAMHAQSITLTVVHDACGNGNGMVSAAIIGSGNLPYTAAWSTGVTTSGDTLDLDIDGLVAGTYTFTLTDALGTVFVETAEVLTAPSLQVNWPGSYSVISCDGGCTYAYLQMPGGAGSGGGPYSVSGVIPGTFNMSSNWLSISSLCAGQVYDVVLTDALGCTAETQIMVVDEPSPNILLQSLTGSCAGDQNGSATFQFDMPVSMGMVYGPPPTSSVVISYPTPGQVQIDGLTVGVYEFYAGPLINTTCHDTVPLVVPALPAGCGSVSGTAYADLDGDCAQDGGEPGLPNRMITIGPTGAYAFTNNQGAYSRGMPLGAYTVDLNVPAFTPNCPASLPAPFSLTTPLPDAQLDLAMTYTSGPDASSFLAASCHAPGFSALYCAEAVNDGPYSFTDLSLEVSFDPILNYLWMDSVPATQGPGTISWSIPTLPPFTTLHYCFTVQVPPDPALIGTALAAQCSLTGPVADANPANDLSTISAIVVGAYDPNEKQVRTSSDVSTQDYLLQLDEHIDYTIRFQNTGTAPAQHVFLIDTIAVELDLGSVEFLGASHDAEISLLPDRVLRFDFPDIQLPDSASDPFGSHGYARFRLKPFVALPGTLYRNTADIYFDFNPPIRTNTSELTAFDPAHVSESYAAGVHISPNPTNGSMHIEASVASRYSLEVIDPLGRSAMLSSFTGTSTRIDVTHLPRGAYELRLKDDGGRTLHARFVLE